MWWKIQITSENFLKNIRVLKRKSLTKTTHRIEAGRKYIVFGISWLKRKNCYILFYLLLRWTTYFCDSPRAVSILVTVVFSTVIKKPLLYFLIGKMRSKLNYVNWILNCGKIKIHFSGNKLFRWEVINSVQL